MPAIGRRAASRSREAGAVAAGGGWRSGSDEGTGAHDDLDEGACSLDLLEAASEFFALTLAQARTVIKEVAAVAATWRDAAKASALDQR